MSGWGQKEPVGFWRSKRYSVREAEEKIDLDWVLSWLID